MCTGAVHDMVVVAGEVAAVDSFDLDHAGAEVGQVPCCHRSGYGLLEGDDGDAVEWLRHNAFFFSAKRTRPPPIMRRWISLVPS